MSKAYYNEFDKKAASWLRELIKRGLIADGDVDERSINDVRADELRGYTQCHFFAGIGGWSLALRLAGWPDDRPAWTGSCPCQPFSVAGKGLGTADERHLWPVFAGLIAECKPPVAFGEQVASRAGREWLAGVRADLEAMGYAVGAADLCAAGVGAPHIRQRLFWMADHESNGLERCGRSLVQRSDARISARGNGSWNCGAHGGLADAGHQQAWRSAAPGQADCGRSFGDASGCGDGGWLADSTSRGQRIDGCAQRSAGHDDERGEDGGMGDAINERPQGHSRNGDDRNQPGRIDALTPRPTSASGCDCWSQYDIIPCGDGKARRIEPGLAPLAHGIPARVVRLRGYGNAIISQVAAAFIRASVEAIGEV